MIKLVDLLKEVQLSSKEQDILDDILSLDEAIDFSSVVDKVKSYIKKGLITATILTSLLNNSAFSQEQKDQIKDVVKTEKQVDNDISFEKFKKLIKDEGFKAITGTMPLNIVKNVKEVKIYRAVGETQAAALQQAMNQARNPIRSFSFSRILKNGNIEVLVAVSTLSK